MQFSNTAGQTRSAFHFQSTLTPAATAAASAVDQNFTVTTDLPYGITLAEGDAIFVTPPASATAVAVASARVNSTGQVTIRFVNPSAGSLTHTAGVFDFFVVRP